MFARGLFFASVAVSSDAGDVERPGPGKAPTAFRIWRAGGNPTDFGVHTLTRESVEAILMDQARRQNKYSFDFDHMSLNDQAPPESHRAAGWHRLAMRETPQGPELWAVDCEWAADVKAGLEAEPPEWKYFSPAYKANKQGVITRYLNSAVTINPATHFVTVLAATTSGETHMIDHKAVAAAMLGPDGDEKEEAKKCYAGAEEEDRKGIEAAIHAALFGPKEGEGEGGGEEKPKEEKPKEEASKATKTAATASAAATKAAAADPPFTAAAEVPELLATIGTQDKRIAELEQKDEERERMALLDAAKDLTPAQRTYLAKKPLAFVKETLASPLMTKPTASGDVNIRAAALQAGVARTRGNTQTGDRDQTTGFRASMSTPTERTKIAERFGRSDRPKVPYLQGNTLNLPCMDRATAQKFLASRNLDQPPMGYMPSAEILSAIRSIDIQKAIVAGAGE